MADRTEREAYLELLKRFEPDVDQTGNPTDATLLSSIAISLKRIADAKEAPKIVTIGPRTFMFVGEARVFELDQEEWCEMNVKEFPGGEK